ncbi:TspO/MBR family protein [Streptacidiphilus sp. ASG 303]|uniref:TspO/MBR family protein n=1 Tax=Streptomycetaceae TaxID=2062 RepID=UPI001E32B6F7|nr:TspO/MBR family protein [Streptacidiphilus sp. ASG 303]MCD0480884.1 tryptophan-rich sensory protein [Streptacidiphilus sp. ASG 303]
MHTTTRLLPAAAVAATAAAGAAATTPDDAWYRRLEKPSWQPPPQAFGLVWTPVYTLIAYSAYRVLPRLDGPARRRYAAAFAGNMLLNAGWTWVFFRARRPRAAVAEIAALQASNADLLRRSWAADRRAGAALLPYVAWTGFATALNTAIARRNPGADGRGRRGGAR